MTDLPDEAKGRLSERRFAHVQGVAATAIKLAVRYGIDEARVERAAWLHDMFRELTEETLTALAHDAGVSLPAGDPVTWHGPLCADRMMLDFQEDDAQIRQAVACHTVGDPDMGSIAQVLYVADAIEPTRDYPGVSLLRQAAELDLRLAVAAVADASLMHLLLRPRAIVLATVELRNRMWQLTPLDVQRRYATLSERAGLR